MRLTQKEFAVLFLLVENEGRILSTKYIYETVWKQVPNKDTGNAVKTIISRLRNKLRDEILIENDREVVGYILTQMPV